MKTADQTYLNFRAKNEHQSRILEGVGVWAAYYRSNIHRFAIDFLHTPLKWFQCILLFMMQWSQIFVLIAVRGIGKTYISAVYCCCKAILYPGSKICIAAGTRGQGINVLEKILNELKPNSPELAAEINDKESHITGQEAILKFNNTSYIKVVTANDGARGNRANVLIIDEFRMVKKAVIDTILRRFIAAPRSPGYMEKMEYANKPELLENNQTLYLSSAYFKDHWSFTRCRDSCKAMLDERRRNFVCGFPYQLSLQEGLLLRNEVFEQMSESDFDPVKWSMEMDAIFWGESEGSFFSFDSVSKNRHIEYAMLPEDIIGKNTAMQKLRIQPKIPGERRILSADIALMASTKHKNDATAIFINQMLPTKAGRFSNNIVYTETNEGLQTEAQALRIRKLFEEYDCDYLALDVKNVGLSIYDLLATDLADPNTGEVYPALSCCNNSDIASRCTVRGARKAIWAMLGSAKFNSECALLLREGFRSGRIRLLVTEYDAEQLFGETKGYGSLSIQDKLAMQLPYINTTLLIGELINLQHDESSGLVRVYEKTGYRKDRYSSLSYNYWVSNQIEKDIHRSDFSTQQQDVDEFIFRAPSGARQERW